MSKTSSGSGPAQKTTASIHDSVFIPGGPVGVLLAHSLGGSPADVRYVAQNLARAGYTVSCPVLAGHGANRDKLDGTTWWDWYASLEEAHDQLRAHCDKVIVGGLSAGGIMTLHLAAKRSSGVDGIVLLSPTLWPDGWAVPWYFNFTRLIRHKWFANLLFYAEREPYGIKDERVRRLVVGALEQQTPKRIGFHGGVFHEFRWMVNAVKTGLGALRQPTLIIHPRQDDRSSLRNVAYLQEKLGGVVETVVLDDCYHVITLDKQRDLVVDRLLAFAGRFASDVRKSQPGQPVRLRSAAE
ncbi:MAG: alpha/beta hydrolase [Hyphomicrobiaceae bacterium]